MMFTVGQTYHLTFLVSAAEGPTTSKAKAIEVALPLARFRDEAGAETMVNVCSIAFVGAKVAEG